VHRSFHTILFLFISVWPSLAEKQGSIDSLLHSLNSAQDDDKYQIYLELSHEYLELDVDKGIQYANSIIADSNVVSPEHLSKAFHNRGSLYLKLEDFSQGISDLTTAYRKYSDINQTGNFESELGLTSMQKGRAERLQGNNYKSLKLLLRGIEHFRAASDALGEANCINHIGIIFTNIRDYESAKKY